MKIRKKDINIMKCTLFLPYTQYSDSSFACDDNYYSEESYTDALNKSLEESKNAVMMLNNSNYDKKNTINFSVVQNYMKNENKSSEKEYLSSCEVKLFNENGIPENIEALINYNLSNDVFILLVNFDFNTIEEEFEEDFKEWVETTRKISYYGSDDDWIFSNLPKRTFKFKCLNKFGGDTFGEFVNCKILQTINGSKYAILVEKLNFINEL